MGLSILEILLLLYGIVVTLVMVASIVLFAGFPRLREKAAETPEPRVSIILPVRNQEGSLRRCLESLLASDYPWKEIILVDGGSTDGTMTIAREYEDRISLLQEPPLPQGWVGKNWGCHQGYEAAKGEILLFTDGDTVHHPQLLGRAAAYLQEENLDLLTLHSRLRVESFWERVVQPLMIFLIGLTNRGKWVNRPDKAWAVANGQFLMFRREAYEAVGGHMTVADRVDEDYRLARLTKERGCRMRMLDGRDVLDVRMYTTLRGIWHGWTKNAFPGMDFSLYKILRAAVGLFLLLVLPFAALTWGLVEAIALPSLLLPVSAFISGLIWVRLAIAHKLLGGKASYSLLTPLGALLIIGILLDSARRYLQYGGVQWKGRTYGIPGR